MMRDRVDGLRTLFPDTIDSGEVCSRSSRSAREGSGRCKIPYHWIAGSIEMASRIWGGLDRERSHRGPRHLWMSKRA